MRSSLGDGNWKEGSRKEERLRGCQKAISIFGKLQGEELEKLGQKAGEKKTKLTGWVS